MNPRHAPLRRPLSRFAALRVPWFVRRFGLREVVGKPLKTLAAPVVIPRLPERTVAYEGRELSLVYHRHNATWDNERCVELAIARELLHQHQGQAVLEVGDVTRHYFPELTHAVVDKYERGDHVISEDIVDLQMARTFDLVLAISTLEHVGFDDPPPDQGGAKLRAAIRKCRGLLSRRGVFVATLPVDYNPAIDALIRQREGECEVAGFVRVGRSEWRSSAVADALSRRFGRPYPYANGLVIATWRSRQH